MAVFHKNLQDPEIHEPKGISTAIADTVYVANGVGGGGWQRLGLGSFAGTVAGASPNDGLATDGAGGIKTFPRFASAAGGWVPQQVVGNIINGAFLDRAASIAYHTSFEGTRIRCKFAGMYLVNVRFKMKAPTLDNFDRPIIQETNLRLCSNNGTFQGPWIVNKSGYEEQSIEYYMPVNANGDIDLRWCTVGGALSNYPLPVPEYLGGEYLFITAVLVAGGITP